MSSRLGRSSKHPPAPEFGAFPARGQVAAFAVETGETEPHRHHGDDLRIVEDLFPDPEPAAQPHARWIVLCWPPGRVRPDA